MPTILSAKESQVLVAGADEGAGEPIEGLQAISYKVDHSRQDIGAIGSDERIGVDFGLKRISGSVAVRSTSDALNNILAKKSSFQITANLRKGDLTKTVAFDNCFLDGKYVDLEENGVVVTTYFFTASSVRDE